MKTIGLLIVLLLAGCVQDRMHNQGRSPAYIDGYMTGIGRKPLMYAPGIKSAADFEQGVRDGEEDRKQGKMRY
jgi:hypothetical protein